MDAECLSAEVMLLALPSRYCTPCGGGRARTTAGSNDAFASLKQQLLFRVKTFPVGGVYVLLERRCARSGFVLKHERFLHL